MKKLCIFLIDGNKIEEYNVHNIARRCVHEHSGI